MGDHGYWASRPDSLRLSSSVSGTRLGVLRAFSLGLVVLRCLCCLRQASALMLFITEQSKRLEKSKVASSYVEGRVTGKMYHVRAVGAGWNSPLRFRRRSRHRLACPRPQRQAWDAATIIKQTAARQPRLLPKHLVTGR